MFSDASALRLELPIPPTPMPAMFNFSPRDLRPDAPSNCRGRRSAPDITPVAARNFRRERAEGDVEGGLTFVFFIVGTGRSAGFFEPKVLRVSAGADQGAKILDDRGAVLTIGNPKPARGGRQHLYPRAAFLKQSVHGRREVYLPLLDAAAGE